MKHPFDPIFTILPLLIVAIFIAIPVSTVYQAITLQKALNQQCNTNYSLMEVALNSDTLTELCKIKNQTVTIK